ncbi:hypothetical protein [Paraburkholderia hospita]|uniref:hypothetical protein n=1 Tax=Paraburkholderia hospita TaxID=169430 RepID=UPI000B349EF5|nr:hypothetical protein [Paraburkholderia hospita]OUL75079.1 hypothetical protein CA603_40185 [Paraburkholderia hospita]
MKEAHLERVKAEITNWYNVIKAAHEFALSDEQTVGIEIPSSGNDNARRREILRQALQASFETYAKQTDRTPNWAVEASRAAMPTRIASSRSRLPVDQAFLV